MGADSSRSGETITWEQFRSLLCLILRNQSTLFREIYNGKRVEELDLQQHLMENEENVKVCFRVYDQDQSGYLDFNEMKDFLQELNLHRQFAKHWDPRGAFENFCHAMWSQFDLN